MWRRGEAAKLPVVSAPSLAFRLSAPLACLALALGGCFGGPTSDFPSKANDDDGAPGANGSDGEGNTGGGASSGTNGDPSTDNGGGGAPMDAGSPPFGEDSDAGTSSDGGAALDGGADAGQPDAGDGCAWSSPAPDAEHCGGSYCDTARAALTVNGGAACSSAGSLDAVCASDPLQVVGACLRTHWLSPSRAMAVKSCAVADEKLNNVSGSCLDCYVALHECMADACAVQCLAEAGAACEACTVDQCGAAFSTCSGLARP